MLRRIKILLTASLCLYFSAPLHAQEDLTIELTPYIWMVGIDADITVGDTTAEVDVEPDDLFDAVDMAGSILGVFQYQQWVMWSQFDYLALDSDELDDAPSSARLETDALLGTLAFGYQFRTFGETGTLDLLAGVRYFGYENEYRVGGFSEERSKDVVDGVIVARPSFHLLSWLRFNPTLSIGAGDSELTYEMWPQLQTQLGALAFRVGYRRVYYDIEDENRSFDGSFHGLIAGVGFIF